MKIIITFLLMCTITFGATFLSKEIAKYGHCNVKITPQNIALEVIQYLAKSKTLNYSTTKYTKSIDSWFRPYEKDSLIVFYKELEKKSFTYDVPPNLMIYLDENFSLKKDKKITPNILDRIGGLHNLNEFIRMLKKITKNTNFNDYFISQTQYFSTLVDELYRVVDTSNLVFYLTNYYGYGLNSFNIIIQPLSESGYGIRIPVKNNFDAFSVCGNAKGPEFIRWVIHEFSHSYINPLTKEHKKRVNDTKILYELISKPMKEQAYTNWESAVNEHIVRAATFKILEKYYSLQNARISLNSDILKNFIYIEYLTKALENYKTQKYNTFKDFYHELMNVFDDLKNIDSLTLLEFKGLFSSIVNEDKVAFIYPTLFEDTTFFKSVFNSALKNYKKYKKANDIFLADTSSLKLNLEEFGIFVFGTTSNNLFLKNNCELPFSINDDGIIADIFYKGDNLLMLVCIQNPFNKTHGLYIYSAVSDTNYITLPTIKGIQCDYAVLTDQMEPIFFGFFNKENKWKFEK